MAKPSSLPALRGYKAPEGYKLLRLVDMSGGLDTEVPADLLADNESPRSRYVDRSLRGIARPAFGRRARYDTAFATGPVSGIGTYVKDDGTSFVLAGVGDTVYADEPHLVTQWDSKADFAKGTVSGLASLTETAGDVTLTTPDAPAFTFSRSSKAYDADGTEYAADTPRYPSVDSTEGILIERGATNLLTANQADVETDTSGFETTRVSGITLSCDTSEHWHGAASLKVVTNGSQTFQGFRFLCAGTAGRGYSASLRLKGSGGLRVVLVDDSTGSVTAIASTTMTLTANWQNVVLSGAARTGTNNVGIQIDTGGTAQAITFYVDGLMLEEADNASTWTPGGTTRAGGTLKFPTAGTLSPTAGTIETKRTFRHTGGTRYIFDGGGGANKNVAVWVDDDDYVNLKYGSGTAEVTATGTEALSSGAWYTFAVVWSTAGVTIYVYDANDTLFDSITDDTAPGFEFGTNAYLGSDQDGANQQDGLIGSTRLSWEARTKTEIEADLGSDYEADDKTSLIAQFAGDLTLTRYPYGKGYWTSQAIDASSAKDNSSGKVTGDTDTPDSSTVTWQSRSSADGGTTWGDWTSTNSDGTLASVANDTVQIRALLERGVWTHTDTSKTDWDAGTGENTDTSTTSGDLAVVGQPAAITHDTLANTVSTTKQAGIAFTAKSALSGVAIEIDSQTTATKAYLLDAHGTKLATADITNGVAVLIHDLDADTDYIAVVDANSDSYTRSYETDTFPQTDVDNAISATAGYLDGNINSNVWFTLASLRGIYIGKWTSPSIDTALTDGIAKSITWTATVATGAALKVEIRTSSDNSTWGDWTEQTKDAAPPAWKRYIQYRMTLSTTDGTHFPTVASATIQYLGEAPSLHKATLSFDGTPAMSALSGVTFTDGGTFTFATLKGICSICNGLDSPAKYDGDTLSALGGSPPKAAHQAVHQNRLWMAHSSANQSRVWFSDALDPETWPVLNFIDVSPEDGDQVTGIMHFGDVLIVWKQHHTRVITGYSTSTFALVSVHAGIGCVAPQSPAIVSLANRQYVAWVADTGVYFSDLNEAIFASRRIQPDWDMLNGHKVNTAALGYFDDEMWVSVPSSDAVRPDMTYHYDTLRTCFDSRPDWAFSGFATFREAGRAKMLAASATEGQIYEIDATTDLGVAVGMELETKALDFGARERTKRIRRVIVSARANGQAGSLSIAFRTNLSTTLTDAITAAVPDDGALHTIIVYPATVGAVNVDTLAVNIKETVAGARTEIHAISVEFRPGPARSA